jgi:phage replication O-like protein O
MADVQLENGYLRIANELFDAILKSDFTKRQRSILDLIIRLSYGCQKVDCVIPAYKDFEVCGVDRHHIKIELEKLMQAEVIIAVGNVYHLNKNYEQWRVGHAPIGLAALVALNLIGYQNSNLDDEEVTKTVTDGYQNSNPMLPKQYQNVTKTVTKNGDNDIESLDNSPPKDIKDILKTSKDIERESESEDDMKWNDEVNAVRDHWNENIRPRCVAWTDSDKKSISAWLNKNITAAQLIHGIDNYALVIKAKPGEYKWTYAGWSLKHFMQRGMERFMDDSFMAGIAVSKKPIFGANNGEPAGVKRIV